MSIDHGSTGKHIEVWFRTSGWGVPRKVGMADIRKDAPTTFRNLAALLRALAEHIDPLAKENN